MSTIAVANRLIAEGRDGLESERMVYIFVGEKWFQVTELRHIPDVPELAEADVVNDTSIIFDKTELRMIQFGK